MTTTENNKIIADFMGIIYMEKNKLCAYLFPNGTTCLDTELKYNSDWNWLMEVIIKIIKLPTEDSEQTYFLRTFGMLTDDGEFMLRFNRHQLFKAESLIEVAYDACVDFIKWHNQQNPKP